MRTWSSSRPEPAALREGRADLSCIYSVTHTIAETLSTFAVGVTKSVVPVGIGKVLENATCCADAFDCARAIQAMVIVIGSIVLDLKQLAAIMASSVIVDHRKAGRLGRGAVAWS
jgi:hypothetical protein